VGCGEVFFGGEEDFPRPLRKMVKDKKEVEAM